MARLSVKRLFKFEAAHHLPKHQGKCRTLHGHSYKLEIEVESPNGGYDLDSSMVVDFGDLKAKVMEVVDPLDHSCLNDILPDPTAESLLLHIGRELFPKLNNDLQVHIREMVLWETENCCAIWRI